MKLIVNNLIICVFIFFSLISCNATKTATSTVDTNYSEMVKHQRFTFVARSVTPTEDSRFNPRLMFPSGNNLYQLSSGYDIRITPDSVIAYLPFYGRAYTAPMDPSKGGIKFTSTNFEYEMTTRKKNFQITITPKDAEDVRAVYLNISPSGYASAQVLSINRTPISFSGIIEEAK